MIQEKYGPVGIAGGENFKKSKKHDQGWKEIILIGLTKTEGRCDNSFSIFYTLKYEVGENKHFFISGKDKGSSRGFNSNKGLSGEAYSTTDG